MLWNVRLDETGRTVGQAILSSPAELEKFLAINAIAVRRSMGTALKLEIGGEQASTFTDAANDNEGVERWAA